MKPYKLLACLVTLQFTCSFTLQAADLPDLRQWTDLNGRTMSARLIEAPDAGTVKIERDDGRVFTVPLKTFSAADQSYVNAWRSETAAAADTGSDSFKDPDADTWTLLNAGIQPATTYSQTSLDHVIESINQRFTVRAIKTSTGQPLQIRTEPSDLATRIQITGDMPRMSVASFVKEIARANDLYVKSDAWGRIVLMNKPTAVASTATTTADAGTAPNFFGVPLRPQ